MIVRVFKNDLKIEIKDNPHRSNLSLSFKVFVFRFQWFRPKFTKWWIHFSFVFWNSAVHFSWLNLNVISWFLSLVWKWKGRSTNNRSERLNSIEFDAPDNDQGSASSFSVVLLTSISSESLLPSRIDPQQLKGVTRTLEFQEENVTINLC